MAQIARRDQPPAPAAGARRPAQKRGEARVAALLDAADTLLQTRDLSEISLYDVANAAGVPPTSAYHFFPTKESVFLSLAERYHQTMHAALDAPFDHDIVEHWQDLIALRYNRVVDYFNASETARKLFLGMALMSDVRRLDFQDMDQLASGTYDSMNRYFEMPFVRDPAFKFSISFAIYDGIWATSYAKHGHITPKYAKAGLQAALAYMSTFLPATIALRTPEPTQDTSPDSTGANAAIATTGTRPRAQRRLPAR